MPNLCKACHTRHDGWRRCPADSTISVNAPISQTVERKALAWAVPASCQECAGHKATIATLRSELAAALQDNASIRHELASVDRRVDTVTELVDKASTESEDASTRRRQQQREWAAKKRADAKAKA